jgi:LysM repeat protein
VEEQVMDVPRTGPMKCLVAVALVVCACQGDGLFGPPASAVINGTTQRRYQPPTRTVYETTLDQAEGASQLADVLRAGALPSEAVVGVGVARMAQGGPGVTIHMVKQGETLTSVAAAHGVTLAALEAANPAFGPASGRDWNLIHPGERLSIPGSSAIQFTPFVNSRLPAGPPPPLLRVPPTCSGDDTSYVYQQCTTRAKQDDDVNSGRIATWSAAANAQLGPALAAVLRTLDDLSAQVAPSQDPVAAGRSQAFAQAVEIAAINLAQLPSPRVLLLAALDDSQPALQQGELDGIDLVVTGPSTPAALEWWTSAARGAGARSVHVLDPILTHQALPGIVNAAR